ncbi:peptidase inhibitor family I36 protein [Streptomyces sp. NPDC089799]|uniref:peptidase inhibitor family I36 protein n=1 Tax=Streptomyces sp. NPDC089799 TaxID=3155066 RepID=UPI00341CF50B
MIRRISATLLAAASLLGAGAALAAPAQAASCTIQNACLYSDGNFTGHKRDDLYSRTNWGNITYDGTSIPLYQGDGVINNVSSIDNWDPDTRVSVFYNSAYAGPCFKIAAYGSASNLGNINIGVGSSANDKMNSHKFGDACVGNMYDF